MGHKKMTKKDTKSDQLRSIHRKQDLSDKTQFNSSIAKNFHSTSFNIIYILSIKYIMEVFLHTLSQQNNESILCTQGRRARERGGSFKKHNRVSLQSKSNIY
uniref:Uncharacterized protein n=1 Tax=Rhizophora mucronata TaxID=61149 RepID=A0A2P2IXM0_RHIMU